MAARVRCVHHGHEAAYAVCKPLAHGRSESALGSCSTGGSRECLQMVLSIVVGDLLSQAQRIAV